MASPITTGGFQVGVMPSINYLPPSQMVGRLADILPSASQGASLITQLQGISDAAAARPIKRQLDQIALQEAQNKLAGNADENKLRGLKIAAAAQPLERIVSTDVARIPRILSPNDAPALDENGNPTFAEGDTNYDLVPVQKVEVTDPVSGEKSIIERRLSPIMTSEQLGERQDKLEISRLREESLGAQRKSQAALAQARAESPDWARAGTGTKDGKMTVIFYNKKTREVEEYPTDLVPVQSKLDAMGQVLEEIRNGSKTNTGAATNIAAPAAAPVVAAKDTVALDEETQSLIDQLKQAAAPAAAPTSFKNMAEAEAAAASGLIKKGQKITVGGQSGTWQ